MCTLNSTQTVQLLPQAVAVLTKCYQRVIHIHAETAQRTTMYQNILQQMAQVNTVSKARGWGLRMCRLCPGLSDRFGKTIAVEEFNI